MDGKDGDLILFDYLPSLARDLYTDEYEMLMAGCWTDEVTLRQSSGRKFNRRLRVQLSGSPIEWGDWGTGEFLTASERMPGGLLIHKG